MKRVILAFILISIIYMVIGNVVINSKVIPEESIRIRVIANSNSDYDQKIKEEVKKELKLKMHKILENSKTIEDVRKEINGNMANIKTDVDKVLQKENCTETFNVNFGLNYFPQKQFMGETYNEGYYESLVVTLGEGLGDNWWCVLFPPFCLIEANESDDVEYTTVSQTILDKYF